MGYYISSDMTKKYQVRFRIPLAAQEIIRQDYCDFCDNTTSELQYSRFLNQMLKEFWLEAESTIEEWREQIYQQYSSWLAGIEHANEIAQMLTQKEIEQRHNSILQRFSYPKRNTEYFPLRYTPDRTVCGILRNSKEDALFPAAADYLSALVQEYAALPHERREMIFFGDIIKEIESGIRKKHEVEIVTSDKTYLMRPYMIATNGLQPYHYVIGYAHRRDMDVPDKLCAFRLQRIQSAEEQSARRFSFTDAEKKECREKLLAPSKIPYLAGDEGKVIVRLTPRGIDMYRSFILAGRPTHTDMVSQPDGSALLTFICTPTQAYQYFIKFGKDAEIIAPQELRERFAKMHKKATGYYWIVTNNHDISNGNPHWSFKGHGDGDL